jgi:hypothetical protein
MIFDHLVLVVNDLESASRHFNRLGFNVIPGGEHLAWGTHNALIGLKDGSYLELLAPVRPWQARYYRLLARTGFLSIATSGKGLFHSRFIRHLAGGEGFADFALLSGDLESDLQAARSRDLDLAGPFEGYRKRTDGQRIAWHSAAPVEPVLPFLIQDVTFRELRVPSGLDCQHPNGASGVSVLSIACLDLGRSVEKYQRLLGSVPVIQEDAPGAQERACFKLGKMEIILSQRAKNVAMRKRSAAPHSISLRSSHHTNPLILQFSPVKGYTLDPALR